MQVSVANDVKVYNLSAGKSVPEWMNSDARRKLERKDVDVRRRIQLIQDFDMPDISHTIDISPDGRYLIATGAYKPWLKCYDLANLSLKFERGLEADVKKVIILSEDYSKFVVLQDDRFIEMHASFGRYFRMRMPRFGRDMAFAKECSDLYLVGNSSEIYRLNLEQGEWLSPLRSEAESINCCQFADAHQLFVCGTADGQVEAFDHRDKNRVGVLDCVVPLLDEVSNAASNVQVTSLAFRDALHLAVGTSSGHVLLYDIRSRRPLLVKDHYNGLPIRKVEYVTRDEDNLVLSMDSRVLKMWDESNGNPFAAIETETALTTFQRYPNSGMVFFANEAPRMLQYFVPALGTAPKWCSYLETITEELEEESLPTVYDDFKFVTKKELDDIGLSHLIGTTMLRAYMHGYFMKRKLYDKAQTLTQPFAFDKYKERKIKEMVEDERDVSFIKKTSKDKKNAPKINRELAARLQSDADRDVPGKKQTKKRAELATSILSDDRFKGLFEKEEFQIDVNSEAFLKNQKIAENQRAKLVAKGRGDVEEEEDDEEDDDRDGMRANENSDSGSDGSSDEEDEAMGPNLDFMENESDDDDKRAGDRNNDAMDNSDIESVASVEDETEKKRKAKQKAKKKAAAEIRRAEHYKEKLMTLEAERELRLANKPKRFMLHSVGAGESTQKFLDEKMASEDDEDMENATMASKKERQERRDKTSADAAVIEETPFGGKSITFTMEKRGKTVRMERERKKAEDHKKERKALSRAPSASVKKGLKRLPGNLNLGKAKRGKPRK